MSSNGHAPHTRVAIVGTGFAGLGMAIRLKQEGMEDFVVLERADDVGGTWRDNSYPGCQCDVPSHLYSFSFAPNRSWTRTFGLQQEIWDYLRDCAERFEILPHVRFGHEVTEAAWDEDQARWVIQTAAGPLTADVLISGMGALSEPSTPEIPGLQEFQGTVFHSATWDHDHALAGERVAVIGTGASAIQFVPRIQPDVDRLDVYQRTPPWILRHPDRAIGPMERRAHRRVPGLQRLARTAIYWSRELLVLGFMHQRAMKGLERLGRLHLHRQVRDPALREKLRPSYRIGCKRILLSDDYYPALTQDNVELVTESIQEVRPHSIVAADGTEREVDTIIFGTGFHVTDSSAGRRVRGRGGVLLEDAWQGSPQAHLGTTISGFPNLFMLVGPNTGLGHTSLVLMIESQIAYVLDALRTMRRRTAATVEVRPAALEAYNRFVQQRMRGTVWTSGGCASWYLDANGRNTVLWPGFTWRFRMLTRRFRADDYELGSRPPTPRTAPVSTPAPAPAAEVLT